MAKLENTERRNAVRTLWANGQRNPRILERLTGFSRSTIYKYVGRLKKNKDINPIPNPGRPSNFTLQMRRTLGVLVSKNPFITVREITASLNNTYPDLKTSESSVNRELNKLGYKSSLPQEVPFLTQPARDRRVEWALAHRHQNWKKVIFSDETTFQMFRNTIRVFHKKENLPPQKPMPKHPYKIHFWGAFSISGTIDYYMFTENLTGDLYRHILSNNLFPSASLKMPRNWIFQQDNDPKHTAGETAILLEQHCPSILDWPSYSPDINPIENLWSIMKRRVEKKVNDLIIKKKSVTVFVFEEIIQKEWENITPELCLNLVNSMQNRLEEVIAKNGNKINY